LTQQISYHSELGRKTIHLSSLGIPAIYLHIEHATGIAILVAMTLVSLAIDVGRHYHAPTRQLLTRMVGPLLRAHEVDGGRFTLTGATWVLIAATLTLSAFPTIVGVTAFTVLIVSDTSAALIGRRFGRRPFLDKSLVGAVAFAVSGMAVVVFYAIVYQLPAAYVLWGAVAAVVSSIVEAASVRLHMDDNITIPFSFAVTLMMGEWTTHLLQSASFVHLLL
jgi:dolichol kinase